MSNLFLEIQTDTTVADLLEQMGLKSGETPEAQELAKRLANYLNKVACGSEDCYLNLYEEGAQGVKASGTFTITDAIATDAITINGTTFTIVSSGATGNQANVGADDNETKDNLIAAINGSATAAVSETVTAVDTSDGVAEVTSVTCVADVSDSLDGTYFVIQDKAGSVGVWIDTDDSGTSEPSHGADRGLEVTGVATDDIAADVATAVAAAIDADGQYSASSDGAVVTITDASVGARAAASAGDSGFTVAEATAGVDCVFTIQAQEIGTEGNAIAISSADSTIVASGANLASGDDVSGIFSVSAGRAADS